MLGAYYGQFRRAVIATGQVSSYYNYPSCCIGQGTGIALSPSGTFYFVDSYQHRLRTLQYANLAVNAPNAPFVGTPGSGDGDSWVAGFFLPNGVIITPNGSTLYLADTGNNRIRAVDSTFKFVTTVAGGASAPASGVGPGIGDGGPGDALFTGPYGITAITNTTLLLTETTTHQLRTIDACAGVLRLAGVRPSGYKDGLPQWDSAGNVDGPGSAARFSSPAFSAVLPNGFFVVADSGNNRLRIVTPAGVVSSLAAIVTSPHGVAVNGSGFIIFSETSTHLVRTVTPDGVVRPLAGLLSGAIDAVGTNARFNNPRGLAVFPASGDVYVADFNNGKLRKISPGGNVTTLCGGGATGFISGNTNGVGTNALMAGPTGLAFLGAALYVADNFNNNIRVIADVTAWPAAVVATLAGLPGGGFADGIEPHR